MVFDLENVRAGYVLTAYGIAAAGLLGLLFFSWRASRRQQDEWSRLQQKRAKNAP